MEQLTIALNKFLHLKALTVGLISFIILKARSELLFICLVLVHFQLIAEFLYPLAIFTLSGLPLFSLTLVCSSPFVHVQSPFWCKFEDIKNFSLFH